MRRVAELANRMSPSVTAAQNPELSGSVRVSFTVDATGQVVRVSTDGSTLSDPSLETDQMVAVETRKPYTELPTAFRYRDAAEFKACEL